MSDELTEEQLGQIRFVMQSPDWYMNGAHMGKGDPCYYEPWLLLNYCLFDLESTDLVFEDEVEKTPRSSFHIVQYYGCNMYNRKLSKPQHSLLNPQAPIPVELSEKVHGIYDKDVVGAPTFIELWPSIVDEWQHVDGLIAYNGYNFDVPGMVVECVRAGIPYEEFEPVLNKPLIDLLVWEKERTGINRNNRLEDVAKRFGVKMMGLVAHGKESLHDARVDVLAMHGLVNVMSEKANMPFTLGKLVELQAKYALRQREFTLKKKKAKKAKKESK